MMRLSMSDFYEAMREARRICQHSPEMVPVVANGLVWCGDSETIPPPDPSISVEDYVLGMEALGASFWLYDDQGVMRLALPVGLPSDDAPEAWHDRARALQEAFSNKRRREIADFLLERGDHPVPINSKGRFD
ncbi:hypothetical protein GCM10011390_50130 [Aureimonas endophytica]|uniref:Uncharacterized protein n=1 Tax=Aureimonas endophytica TaxID=2027858 RepID=A0A917A5J8_9HYPH|nr:hypothetical protein [Aureimonas endophytica]GGE24669.1 hypothetical protein GCM10011390_50130 [Aureimonas endophytica]